LFRTDVTVLGNGALEVVEEIAVNDAASFYKYGFRRDLRSLRRTLDSRYVGQYKQDNGIRVTILG